MCVIFDRMQLHSQNLVVVHDASPAFLWQHIARRQGGCVISEGDRVTPVSSAGIGLGSVLKRLLGWKRGGGMGFQKSRSMSEETFSIAPGGGSKNEMVTCPPLPVTSSSTSFLSRHRQSVACGSLFCVWDSAPAVSSQVCRRKHGLFQPHDGFIWKGCSLSVTSLAFHGPTVGLHPTCPSWSFST